MKNEGMTELQRKAVEHFEKARQEGLSISAYSRTHGIVIHQQRRKSHGQRASRPQGFVIDVT